MKTKAISLCAGLLLFLCFGPAAAEQPGDLYAAEVAVADEGSEARNAALSKMLADVLVRVSGNAGVAGMPAARDLLGSAPSLVQQYRYRTLEGEGAVSIEMDGAEDSDWQNSSERERYPPPSFAKKPSAVLSW